MKDTTIEAIIVEPLQDTLFFGCLSPEAYKLLTDVQPVLGGILGWTQLSVWFLGQIIRALPAGGELVMSHLNFARKFWSDISDVAARRRIGRAVSALIIDMTASGFQAVWIQRGDKLVVDGREKWIDTTYGLVDFFVVFAEIQVRVLECDLFRLSENQRRGRLVTIIQGVCDARGYRKIVRQRQQRHFQTEAKAKAEPLPKAEALPTSLPYTKALDWYCEQLLAHLTSLGKGRTDAGFNAAVDEAGKAIRLTERKALDIIHGRSVKLVGGQPK